MHCFVADEEDDDDNPIDRQNRRRNDIDFLSSIEILIVHRSDVCLCRTGTTSTGLRGEGGVKGGGDNAVAMSCLILFPKDDGCAFKRIVGSNNAEQMVNGDKGAYLFYS